MTYLTTLSKTNQQQKTRIRYSEPHHGSWWVLVFWHQLGTNALANARQQLYRPDGSFMPHDQCPMGDECAKWQGTGGEAEQAI